MALKFDFNKLRTAVKNFTVGTDVSNGSLAAGEEAKFTPHMRLARPVEAITNAAAVTRTLTTVESGTLFTLDMTTADNNVTITLPAASSSAGVYFDFCWTADCDDNADFILTTGDDSVDFYGYIVRGAANSTVQDVDGDASKLTLDASVTGATDTEGMNWHVLCNGVDWILRGYSTDAVGDASIVLSASA